jgi:fermentation-respiration switch protein FrsA (DUF1100 family)
MNTDYTLRTWPHAGRFWPARGTARPPIVVFIHHFGGDATTTRRHVRFVNALGFDALTFSASHNHQHPGHFVFPRTRKGRWGLRHLWAEEILDLVESLDRPFVYYSFSSLSNSVVEAIAHGERKPIGWICDGGPFVMTWDRLNGYVRHIVGIENQVLRFATTTMSYLSWNSWSLARELKDGLDNFPVHLPVLCFVGEKDPLVPAEMTRAVFKLSARVLPKIVAIPDGAHLDGLKNHREIYAQPLRDFLMATAKP